MEDFQIYWLKTFFSLFVSLKWYYINSLHQSKYRDLCLSGHNPLRTDHSFDMPELALVLISSSSSSSTFSSVSSLPALSMLGERLLTSLVATVSTHMGQTIPSSTSLRNSDLHYKIKTIKYFWILERCFQNISHLVAGNLQSGHMVRSVGVMWYPVAMQYGREFLHWLQYSSDSGTCSLSLSFSSVGICIHLVCAVWTSCGLLGLLRSLGLPNDGLDLLPIFLVYFLSVLRPHQSGRVGEGWVLEAGPVALYHGGRQDGDDVTGELAKRRVQSQEKNV